MKTRQNYTNLHRTTNTQANPQHTPKKYGISVHKLSSCKQYAETTGKHKTNFLCNSTNIFFFRMALLQFCCGFSTSVCFLSVEHKIMSKTMSCYELVVQKQTTKKIKLKTSFQHIFGHISFSKPNGINMVKFYCLQYLFFLQHFLEDCSRFSQTIGQRARFLGVCFRMILINFSDFLPSILGFCGRKFMISCSFLVALLSLVV